MRFTRIAVLLFAFLALSAFAAESKHDKDVRDCRKAPPVMKHPGDLKRAKAEAFNACMAARGYAIGKIRAK